MATKDDRPGLLSKVALFVRNPTRDWSELDQPSLHEDTGYDKQALQSMIERKRQNDFIRRREFDQLRKLRNRDPGAAAATARPSFFQNSISTDQDGRAVTLKKIDEIEAQMSKQWWKNKTDAQEVQPRAKDGVSESSNTVQSQVSDSQRSRAFDSTLPFSPTVAPDGGSANDFLSTQHSGMMKLSAQRDREAEQVPVGPGTAEPEFSVSRLFEPEVDEIATDPELEEAAIRFANGDVAGAEKSLLDALRGKDLAPSGAQSWAAALLDLYRATSRRTEFDQAASEFYVHLDGAHPVWSNLGAAPHARTGPAGAGNALWRSPALLEQESMLQLQELMASHSMPWHMDWSALQEISPDALELLHGLFVSLCDEPVEICCAGLDVLLAALRARTPRGERQVDALWWQVRMNLLRVLSRQDEFDLLEFDYCVTYETSPPGWQDVRCQLEQVEPHEMHDVGPATAPMQYGDEDGLSALRGEILGDATEALSGLLDFQVPGQLLLIGCSELLRVDFAAAGSILNWVAERQTEGRQIQFHNVHRLVAAFFNVIGINEHAKVIPRAI